MKKIVIMISIIMAILLPLSAVAEEFTLRNGIHFGDTMEEVLAKETVGISHIEDGSESTEDSDKESEDDDPPTYSIRTENTTLAGIDDSHITYYFDAEKTLREVVYYFGDTKLADSSDSNYESVNGGLKRKYGAPLGNSNGSCYIVTGEAIEHAVTITYILSTYGGVGDIRDYDEWVIDNGDYSVKIDHVQFYQGSSYSNMSYSHVLGYKYFTDADVEDEQNQKREQQAVVDSDL